MTASIKRANVIKPKRHPLLAGSALLIAFSSPAALATNGYFAHGYGVKSQGIAGIGVALPQDGLAAATNPAGTALTGDRVDLGITLFRPDRDSEVSGSPVPGFNGQYDGNETGYFLIPEIGYTRQLSQHHAIGCGIRQRRHEYRLQKQPLCRFWQHGRSEYEPGTVVYHALLRLQDQCRPRHRCWP